MGDGVEPFCLGFLETLFSASNKPNLTYMAAMSDFFGKFVTFAKSTKIMPEKPSGAPRRRKRVLEVKVVPKYRTQYECGGQTLLFGAS